MITSAGFNSFLRTVGQEVVVYSKTPTYDDDGNLVRTPSRDDDGNILPDGGAIIYDEEDVVLLARINMLRGSEKEVDNAFVEEGDAIGLFKLKDAQYLNKGNTVSLSYETGLDYYFQMMKPIQRMTHIEVGLKRRER